MEQKKSAGTSKCNVKGAGKEVVKSTDEEEEMFEMMDTNRDGVISLEEFKAVFLKSNSQMTDKEITAVFRTADTNNDGFLQFDEYLAIVQPFRGVTLSEEEVIRSAFNSMDRDGDGYINEDDLEKFLSILSPTKPKADIKKNVKLMMKPGNRKIGFKDFADMYKLWF